MAIKPTKYFLYARKSSEDEDRQVASIDAQINELKRIAVREGFEITEILSESFSAKAPGRPVFNELLKRVALGEARGILCWKLDRLARNPVDGGQIAWMLQQGVIECITTYDHTYLPTDNVLTMSVEFGMANQFIRDLSANTKRGLRAKLEKGWLPSRAPIGYRNNKYRDKGEKDIIKDELRFPIIKRMWEMLIKDRVRVAKIHEVATQQWGLTSIQGNILSKSKTYEIFTNPFYYGSFEYNGTLYKGKHTPMITEEEFIEAQYILGIRNVPRPHTREFPFTGLIRCGECGASITAETKTKHQKNGNVHNYTYYRCTKRINPSCSQRPIKAEELTEQIKTLLGSIQIPEEFLEWGLKVLRDSNAKEAESRNAILSSQQRAYDLCLKKIDGLIDMRAAQQITEEEYERKRGEAILEKDRLHTLLNDTDKRADNWLRYAEEMFSFAHQAKESFEKGGMDGQRKVLQALGSNLLLKDKKLSISLHQILEAFRTAVPEINSIHKRLEPLESIENTGLLASAYTKNPLLGA